MRKIYSIAIVAVVIVGACFGFLLAGTGQAQAQTTYYVNANAGGANDGSSWVNAYTDLKFAMNNSGTPCELWVASGTYYPGNTRGSYFALKNDMALYGGFPNMGSPTWNDRDWVANPTVCSGDIGTPNYANDNCRHIFYHPAFSGLDNTAILDGFIVTGGRADGNTDATRVGGGIYNNQCGDPVIRNCFITDNFALYEGGGFFILYSDSVVDNCIISNNRVEGQYNHSAMGGGMFVAGNPTLGFSPTISNCTFSSNVVVCTAMDFGRSEGGGLYIGGPDTAPKVTNCTFYGNSSQSTSAAIANGGGIAMYWPSPVITNCEFTANDVEFYGGGIYIYGGGSPVVRNCWFRDNTADYGGGLFHQDANTVITNCVFYSNVANSIFSPGGGVERNSGSVSITNSIIWANTPSQIDGTTQTTYSNIQGGLGGNGNISGDPLFIDPGAGDFHLQDTSPCIEAGSNAAAAPIVNDIDGQNRIIDSDGDAIAIVEMGIDETSGTRVFVDKDAVGADDGTSWVNAFVNLQDGLAAATSGKEIWVAAGTYTPVRPGSPGQRTDSFAMKSGVGVYGGFNATETARDQRDPGVNLTILTGEIGNPGTATDNCYHVFYHSGSPVLDGSAVLDGFIISDGYADGGGNDNNGAGMFNNSGSPTITNCIFENNYANTDGGGMYNQNGAAPGISGCLFNSNSATDGGGMYNAPVTAPVISSGTFSNNSAIGGFGWGAGGGIYNENNDAVIDGTVFINNTATWEGGGAFTELGTTPSYNGCLFWGNHAIYGGGMSIRDTDPPITNCEFSYNTADYGAGLYANSCGSVIDGSYFVANDATTEGGGIFNTYFSGSITGCVFGGPLSGDGNSAVQHGGGIYNDNSSPPITGCLFWNNSGSQGGAIYNAEYSNVVITSGTFMNNVAWDRGGGIYSAQNFGDFTGSDITLTGCTFEGNLAQWGGGAFYNDYGDPAITDCDFNNNVAWNIGGGMYTYSGDPVITRTSFWYNTGTRGGGIYNAGIDANVAISSGTFTGNHANENGGGIFNGGESDGTISNCYFTLNTAGQDGGGMCNDSDYNDILNCTFDNNFAANGGGMYNYGNFAYIEGTAFLNNTASIRGGGAFNDGADTPEYVACEFYNNTAPEGGGMVNFDWIDTPITNCLFWYNTGSDGGAMFNWADANPVITNCTFYQNTASGSGSGIFNLSGTPTITNCILWDDPLNEVVSNPTCSVSINYSNIAGGYPTGVNNINLDPLFIGPMDPRLQPISPCINAGSDGAVPAGIVTDFDGNPRFIGPVDMGAFEDNSMEFGDAPAPTYPTLLASNGARHGSGALLLGALKDFEPDGQPTPASDGDDNNNLDDEDGVFFPPHLYSYPSGSGTVTIDVVASGSCNLSAWMDFNIDGDWADAGENIFADQVLAPGTNSLSFPIPAGATPGTTHARFRATTDSGINYDGLATDGEVEDYQVVILNGAGTIIVEKVTNPVSGTDTFTFVGDAADTISHGEQIIVPNLMPGTYTSRELFTIGWELTDITCDDSNSSGDTASGSITFRVGISETVTCYCTNTQLNPSAEAADSAGAGKDQFRPDETVYGAGSQFTPGSSVDIYITPDFTWIEGMPIAGTLMATAVVNGSGTFHTLVWPPPLVVGEYDMVFDANQNGNYDTRTDMVDDPNHPGFVVARPGGGGPTVGGQVMMVNKAALVMQLIRFPMGLMMGLEI